MVTGKQGAGKSSLVNAINGRQQVAYEGKCLGGVTREVTRYSTVVNGVQFNIWDTPGLQDTTESDDAILDKITTQLRQECTGIHLLVYCLRMNTDRIEISEELAIKRLTDCFGPKIWEMSVIALTFANKVDPPTDLDTDDLAPLYFNQRLEQYKHQIINILGYKCQMYERKASEIVAVIPTGYHQPTRSIPNPYMLPDRGDWFNIFWIACADRMKETACRLDFVKLHVRKTNVAEDLLKKDEKIKMQAEQHQPILKRMQQEHEAKMREQEKNILEEKEKWQKKQLETEQETERKLQQMEREMRNELQIE